MTDKIDVNKASDKDKRRAEHIEDMLEKRGQGHGQSEREGLRQAVDQRGYSAGGANAAGEGSKHANHERDHRLGSEKKPHSGQP